MSAVLKESESIPFSKALFAYFIKAFLKKSQYLFINLLEIPFEPGAEVRFALLMDWVNSSKVNSRSKSNFSASVSFEFLTSVLFKISSPKNFQYCQFPNCYEQYHFFCKCFYNIYLHAPLNRLRIPVPYRHPFLS
jgi:hypothetical protein